MSMTGSLMGYENNNEINNQVKNKKILKTMQTNMVSSPPVSSSSANSTTMVSNTINISKTQKIPSNIQSNRKRDSCNRGHANGLWSVWYGILVVSLQAYIATRCAKRFVAYLSLPWPADFQPPKFELHVCIVLTGTGVLLLPILLAAAFLKLGNLANDGMKLGRHTSTCTRDHSASIIGSDSDDNGLAASLWKHGGPTAAFVHLCTAMCFLLPSLLMEARLIYAGFLPKDAIWRTDLDWIVIHQDRLVYLSFMNPAGDLNNLSTYGSTVGNTLNLDDIASHLENNQWSSTLSNNSSESALTYSSGSPINKNELNRSNYRSSHLFKKLELLATSTPPSNMKSNKNSSNNRENMTAHHSAQEVNTLMDLNNLQDFNYEITDGNLHFSEKKFITLEYLNYAMALAVYSVRYPAVFWSCNKVIGTIFSIQLVINSAQSLISYAGMSVLYKVQVVGPHKVLSPMRHRTFQPASNSSRIQRMVSSLFGDTSHLLLNPHVTLALFALSSLLVLCSSMVTYLYAYGRFATFLEQEHERRVIISKEAHRNGSGWAYFTHCAALCVFLALTIVNAPLLYDYTVIYRSSLDGIMLACIFGTIIHLLLWIVFWFFLSIKKNWIFKVRVTIARATVRSTRSVKLVTDVDLLACRIKNQAEEDDEDDPEIIDGSTNAPLLIVGDGKTYSIAESSPKKAIMSVIQKAMLERKAKKSQTVTNRANGEPSIDTEEQIYWLRPKLRPSPAQSPSGNGSTTLDKSWLNKKLKPKVTFNDLPSTSGSRNKGKRRGVTEGGPDDDGDYATLRELPLMTNIDAADDSASEENKTNGITPRCLRQIDPGMSDQLTPRSDSSNSPAIETINVYTNHTVTNYCDGATDRSNTSSNSESSSGIHSNISNNSHNSTNSHRRATSVDNLSVNSADPGDEDKWKSGSLQRGTQPPNFNNKFSTIDRKFTQAGCPAVILESANEATVVIRRRLSRPKITEPLNPNDPEPFSRSTNMRMTSFTENTDLRNGIHASSATLPHYPTQPIVPTYPHCSTMPLPHGGHVNGSANVSGYTGINGTSSSGGSCGSVPYSTAEPHSARNNNLTIIPPVHTTLPTNVAHHNGRLGQINQTSTNLYVKRFPNHILPSQNPWPLPGHHTFPQPIQNKFMGNSNIPSKQSERDSANFSMASSGDSDICLQPH
ncbi:protein tincar isoform X2 [Chelonus insularis]|uniref:protein tincar isoform X2 n=1 Tax=Chelonus insularis TaxID=460826 RepID=UPI00158A47F6|nr:protein tincar isoform X2 [Chelonus insularis]